MTLLYSYSLPNKRRHSDSKKRRSSFLVALLFAAGDAWCSIAKHTFVELEKRG